MSPPIRDGSGSSIGSIRLGDGSEISEVRTGAGDVLFSAIPDSGLLHNYNPKSLSLSDGNTVSTRTDNEQSGDLSATSSPVYRTSGINGNPIVEYDGSDDFHQGTFPTISPPFETFHVFKARSLTKSETFQSGVSSDADWIVNGSPPDSWLIFDGSNSVATSTVDTNPHIGIVRWASDGEVLLESTVEASGDLSGASLDGLTIGAEFGGGNPAPIDSGQFMIYDPTATGYSRSDVISYLKSEWGPF